jgi:two-component system, LuxR family, response regulator FixJ
MDSHNQRMLCPKCASKKDRGCSSIVKPMNTKSTIFVVEPDPAICESVKAIASLSELRCETYATGQEFLERFDGTRPGCLVLEIRIPGVNGLQIQQKLLDSGAVLPLIFLTAAASVSIAVHAMRMGAFHFLEKPFHEHDLWTAIQEAIQLDQQRREAASQKADIDSRIGVLSEKEIVVLQLLADCKNKQAMADELGVSVRTVEHHRTQLMRKLKTNSVAGLLHLALAMKQSSPRILEKSVASSPEGNGFVSGGKVFIPHNGHTHQSPDLPARRRNSK